MPETLVPQNLSSELAKAAVLPDVLKNARIDWVKVKKVDGKLDKIPKINALGGEIEIDRQVDAEKMRKATPIKAGEKDTNLVDYITGDEQLRILLQEGIRLGSGIITEQDLKDVGLNPKNYQTGEKAGLKLAPLDRLQKAEVISLILHRLGESNAKTTSQYLSEAGKLMFDQDKVVPQIKGVFSPLTLLNALAAGGREELSRYIIEQGYDPYSMKPGESQEQRRVMAKLVKEAYGEGEIEKVLSGEAPYIASYKEGSGQRNEQGVKEGLPVPEYSAVIDLHIAQAITNVMIPSEFHVAIAKLESQVRTAGSVAEAEDLRHKITRSKQKIYAALLSSFNVKGYGKDGEVYSKLGFSVDDQVEIDTMAKKIKEGPYFKDSQNLTMFEANRGSLALIASEICGIPTLKEIVKSLPIEGSVEALREQFRGELVSEDLTETVVREFIAEKFVLILDAEKKRLVGGEEPIGLNDEQKDLCRMFFIRTYDTERKLIKQAHRRFKDADAPTKVKIGSPEAINQGIKGLNLLFRRSVTEQRYDWDTYKQLVIEGAAQAEQQVPGAVLEQGLEKTAADYGKMVDEANAENQAFDKRAVTDEALAENKRRDALAENKARTAAVEAEEKAQKDRVEFENRSPSESLAIEDPNSQYTNELMAKIDGGLVTSEEIQNEMNAMLLIPKGQEWFFRGPLRSIKEKDLEKVNKGKKAVYDKLKEALGIAKGYERIPDENIDEILEARKKFFKPEEVDDTDGLEAALPDLPEREIERSAVKRIPTINGTDLPADWGEEIQGMSNDEFVAWLKNHPAPERKPRVHKPTDADIPPFLRGKV